VRPIIGAQLANDILDVEIDSGFRNGQLVGNLLIAIAISNEPEYIEFPARKVVVAQMFGEAGRDLWWNMPFAGMDRANHVEQFVSRHAFKDVSRGAGT
jgi:hypothetical protein